MAGTKIEVARIYEALVDAAPDGEATGGAGGKPLRVLVDRLWPRGVSRDRAAIDLWAKDATPSTELRKTWHADPHGHDPAHFEAFEAAYRAELAEEPARTALAELARAAAKAPSVLLLTAAKDPEVSHVPVIREALEAALG